MNFLILKNARPKPKSKKSKRFQSNFEFVTGHLAPVPSLAGILFAILGRQKSLSRKVLILHLFFSFYLLTPFTHFKSHDHYFQILKIGLIMQKDSI